MPRAIEATLAPTLPSLLISSILCTPIFFLPGLPSSRPKQRRRRAERWWSARACSNPKVFRAHSREILALRPVNKTLSNTLGVSRGHISPIGLGKGGSPSVRERYRAWVEDGFPISAD